MRSKQGSIQSESAPLLAQPAKGGTDNGPLVWLLAVMAFLGSAGIAMTWGAQMVAFNQRACTDAHHTWDAGKEHCDTDDGNSSSLFGPMTLPGSAELGASNGTSPAGQQVGKAANKAIGNYGLLQNVVNFLGVMALGELSDCAGRRLANFLAQIGAALTCLIFAQFALTGSQELMLGLTAVACLAGGQFGQNAGIFSVLADVTAHLGLADRTIMFAKVVLGLYIGLVVGPVVGGLLVNAKVLKSIQLFYLSAAIFGVNAVLSVVALRETRPVESRGKFQPANANPFGGIILLMSEPATLRVIGLEVGMMLTLVLVCSGIPNTLVQVGQAAYAQYFYAAMFAAVSLGNMVLPSVIKAIGVRKTVWLGTLAGALTLPLLSVPLFGGIPFMQGETGMWVCILCVFQAVGGMWDAPCRTLAVSQHPDSKISLATAGLTSLQCIMQGISAKITGTLLTVGTSIDFPWLNYMVALGCGLLAFSIALTLPDIDPSKEASRA